MYCKTAVKAVEKRRRRTRLKGNGPIEIQFSNEKGNEPIRLAMHHDCKSKL